MRRHRTSLLLAVPFSLFLAVSGCTGTEGTATGSGAPPAAGSGGKTLDSIQEKAVQYTKCMRDNDVAMKDPVLGTDGSFEIRVDLDQTDPESAKYQAANTTCGPIMGDGGEPEKVDADEVEALRKWAKCLRENGLPDYPDPESNGKVMQTALDPNDPVVKAATAVCDKLRNPGSGE